MRLLLGLLKLPFLYRYSMMQAAAGRRRADDRSWGCGLGMSNAHRDDNNADENEG